MEKSLNELSCREFTSSLSSKSPAPGGGGAAALMGALGTALCAMAGNLTVGKKKFADVEDELRGIISEADDLRLRFEALIDEDAQAFEPLSKAYSMPKDEPNYAEIMRRVTLDACRAPFEMLRCGCRAVELLENISGKCSKLLISDVGCGAVAARAALEAAAINVFVNTRTLKGDEQAEAMEAEAAHMLSTYTRRAEDISEKVLRQLRGLE